MSDLSDGVKRAIRTFLVVFLGVAIPGALDWLKGLTDWAGSQGQTAFPDMSTLTYVGVGAIVAGVVTLLNLALVFLENSTGKGFLRTVPPKP